MERYLCAGTISFLGYYFIPSLESFHAMSVAGQVGVTGIYLALICLILYLVTTPPAWMLKEQKYLVFRQKRYNDFGAYDQYLKKMAEIEMLQSRRAVTGELTYTDAQKQQKLLQKKEAKPGVYEYIILPA